MKIETKICKTCDSKLIRGGYCPTCNKITLDLDSNIDTELIDNDFLLDLVPKELLEQLGLWKNKK